ncbi:MAG: lysoplasmalogenase [Myxococcota bacterium]
MRLAWVLGLLAAVGFFVGFVLDLPLLRVASKPLPVLCMAGVVFAAPRSRYTDLIGIGLVLSALGDLLLEVDRFLLGLVAFLAGHLLYIAAYVSDSRALRPGRAVPAFLFGVAVVGFLWGGLGDMRVPVAVYTLVICTMLWRAAARLEPGTPGQRDRVYALAGAIAFALSDSLVALRQFGSPPEAIRWAIMLLYWSGQLGIAASGVVRGRPEP